MKKPNRINQKLQAVDKRGAIQTCNSSQLQDIRKEMAEAGFVPLIPKTYSKHKKTSGPSYEETLQATVAGGVGVDGENLGDISTLYVSSGTRQMDKPTGVGTEGLGWISYGMGNRLPNLISLLVQMSPYLATAFKFNLDVAAGLGPVARYKYAYYNGGNISTRTIDFQDAGELLKGEIVDLERQLTNLYLGKTSAEGETADVNNTEWQKRRDALAKTLQSHLDEKSAELEEWRKSWEGIKLFLEGNNLMETFTSLFSDMILMGMCYPEIRLSANRDQKGETWKPQVEGIGYRPLTITRLEELDKDNKIHNVYCSNRWWDINTEAAFRDNSMVAIPTIDSTAPTKDLRNKVRDQRIDAKTGKLRQTNYVLPVKYPTPGRPYYTVQTWQSCFAAHVYEYLMTIIDDRNTRRKNRNRIGSIVYVSSEYLDKLYQNQNASTMEEKERLRDELWDEINEWLENKDNSGSSILAFSFTGSDGKEHKSFEVQQIEAVDDKTARADKTELEEVANIVLFCMEVNGDLVGARPGGSGSMGGTAQREMYLIKTVKMGTIQEMVLKPLEVVSRFMGWTDRLVWEIRSPKLTTLDASKTGVTEG